MSTLDIVWLVVLIGVVGFLAFAVMVGERR